MFDNLFIKTVATDPAYFFAVLITVVISITLHELAHGFVAVKLGDDTPIHTGHMTLNPIVHMGIISLVLLAIAWRQGRKRARPNGRHHRPDAPAAPTKQPEPALT